MVPIPAPFRFPVRGERAIDTLLIGGGLHLATVFVPFVPLVVVLGYLVVLLGETTERDRPEMFDALPPFWMSQTERVEGKATSGGDGSASPALDQLRAADVFHAVLSLTRRGLGSVFVVAVYLLPATIILVVTVAGVSGLSPTEISTETSMGFLLGSTTSLLLAATFAYLLPAALGNYATTGQLRAAFAVGFLVDAATDAGYFYNVLTGGVVGATLLVLADLLTAVVVGFFLAFYAELVTVAFWARGVRNVRSAS